MVFFGTATLLKKTPAQVFSWEHCKIFENTYIEKHLRTAASDSSYILFKKLNKIVQKPDCLSVSFWNIKLLSFVLNNFITRCHSLSFSVIFFYSLPFVVNRCTTRCQSLCHSLSLVVTCCTTKRSFSSIDLLDSKDVNFQKKFDRW